MNGWWNKANELSVASEGGRKANPDGGMVACHWPALAPALSKGPRRILRFLAINTVNPVCDPTPFALVIFRI
jgi:hypothetical protein